MAAARATLPLAAAVRASAKACPPGSEWVLAVSGGLDSTVLARVAAREWSAGRLPNVKKISLLHVDHALRGKESRGDALFVQALGAELGLAVKSVRIRWGRGEKPSQASARTKREMAYAKGLGEKRQRWIVTAHHLNDQAETLFLRILRGTGLRGLAGMSALGGGKIRPFLGILRSQIQSAAAAEKWEWREDHTNSQDVYERNWLRHNIWPLLEKKRPGLAGRLGALAAEAAAAAGEEHVLAPVWESEGSMLYRAEDLRKAGAGAWAKAFALDRGQTELLAGVLKKGAGKCTWPGGRVAWLSCGWLKVEIGLKRKSAVRPAGRTFATELGSWERLHGKARLAPRKRTLQSGRWKKILLATRLPAFARESVPEVVVGAEALMALPPRWENCEFHLAGQRLRFRPSAFCLALFTPQSR